MNDYESTFEGFMMFRLAEDTPTTHEWVEASANPEYEKHLLEQYDKMFK